jgi:hypothetical protein
LRTDGDLLRSGFSADFQIALPYQGWFVWHVGHDHAIGDSRNILFVSAGEKYRVTAADAVGYRVVIITPAISLLNEMTDRAEATLRAHPLFRDRSRNATHRLSVLRMRLSVVALAVLLAMAIDGRIGLRVASVRIDTRPRAASSVEGRRGTAGRGRHRDGFVVAPLSMTPYASVLIHVSDNRNCVRTVSHTPRNPGSTQ